MNVNNESGFYTLLTNELRDKEIEMEYKIKLDQQELIAILKEMRSQLVPKMELQQTINLLGNNDNIMTIHYRNGSKTSIMYMKKSRLADGYIEAIPFVKLSLSREKKRKDPDAVYSMARIKNRLSFDFGEVRLDVTQVMPIENNKGSQILFSQHIKKEAMIMFQSTQNLRNIELFNKFISECTDRFLEFEIEVTNTRLLELPNIVAKYFKPLGNYIVIGSLLSAIGKKCDLPMAKSIKKMLPSAMTMSKKIYKNKYPPIGCFVTKKSDGERCLLIKTKDGEHIISSKYSGSGGFNEIVHVLDCELIGETLIPFDALIINGKSVCEFPYKDRLKLITIDEFKLDVRNKAIREITSENIESVFKRADEEKSDFPDDGHMLIEGHQTYQKTKSWKIKEDNTIDFLAIPYKGNVYLFNGATPQLVKKMGIKKLPEYEDLFEPNNVYMPIQFCPADSPNEYIWSPPKTVLKIIEESSRMINGIKYPATFVELSPPNWNFVGIREDRFNLKNYYGNDFFKVAQFNWFVSQDPLKIRDMSVPPESYFNTKKNTRYHSQIFALSMIKDLEIEYLAMMSQNRKVCVLAAGNGQDNHRIIKYGFEESVNIDNDRIALGELINRRMKSVMENDVLGQMEHSTIIQYADLTKKAKDVWKNISKHMDVKPDTCICNLAIHYFMANESQMKQFGILVSTIIDKGMFMYTCFDGQTVFDLLKDGSWTDMDGQTTPKYILEKRYKSTKFIPGLKIGVKLPFSNELYDEYLVDIKKMNDIFVRLGFKVERCNTLDYYFEEIEKKHKTLKLNESDKFYLSLYQCTIVKRS